MYEINNFKRANTILNKVDAHMLLRFCFSHVYHKTHSFTATGNKIQALKSTNRESYRAGTILITNIIMVHIFLIRYEVNSFSSSTYHSDMYTALEENVCLSCVTSKIYFMCHISHTFFWLCRGKTFWKMKIFFLI